ncbi:hypothetical protein CTAYLR_010274 [Chrysophaeum taylorii]|uniref:Pseudouridine synthase RsuA/RluA-like domain-containing protein n=1 Tax=Chrysophaeum taylorii TaxID=2483200 RepID=A0AAD7XHS6_9STRA|nr:hypothetical protein CTAYLR_010274 [Chrysophaeum taylorii]
MCCRREVVILYRCERYVAIDKPPDTRIDGGRHDEKADEPNALALLRRLLPAKTEVRHCHQLDYATSGVMLYALSKKAAAAAAKLFEARRVHKSYVALVAGHVVPADLECSEPICQDPSNEFKMMCGDRDVVWPDDKKRRKHSGPASTSFFVVARGTYKLKPVTKMSVEPASGRRHQIRLHALALGHPIVGDATYAPIDPLDDRMMLHARELRIPLDDGEKDIVVRAQDPFCPDLLPGLELDAEEDLRYLSQAPPRMMTRGEPASD